MSIAALSSAFVSHVRSRQDSVAAAAPVRAVDRFEPQRHGRRHELVDAMAEALGIEEPDRRTQQAVFRFAHALMHDLRAVAAPQDAVPGAGRAWGRQSWSDLGSRIDALATAVGGGAAAQPADDGASSVPAADGSASTVPDADAAAGASGVATGEASAAAADAPAHAVGELAPPEPLTQTSAALWLSQVPSSRLLEAFATLTQALPPAGEAAGTAGPATADTRTALADFLHALSARLEPSAAAEPGAGSLFHATA